jgi:hypothetical protein
VPTRHPPGDVDDRPQGSGRMRQDLKVVLVFLLFVEVMHSLGYVSGWW